MSTQKTDTSTSNYNWGTLVIVLWVVIGAFVLWFLIKNGDLQSQNLTYSAPNAPISAPATVPAPENVPAAATFQPGPASGAPMPAMPAPAAAPAGPAPTPAAPAGPAPTGPAGAPVPAPGA